MVLDVRRPLAIDVGLAAGVAVVQGAGTYLAGRHQVDRESFDVLAGALLLAGPAALVERRRFPVAVYATAFASTLAYVSLGYPRGPIFLSLIVAFLTVVLAGHRVVGWVGLATGYVAFLWAEVVFQDVHAPGWAALVGLAAWLLVLAAAGEGLRIRKVRAEETARAQEEEARRRAGEERLRIARELHDVLAHNTRPSAPAPAGSWSRTPNRWSCSGPCGPSPPVSPCCRPAVAQRHPPADRRVRQPGQGTGAGRRARPAHRRGA